MLPPFISLFILFLALPLVFVESNVIPRGGRNSKDQPKNHPKDHRKHHSNDQSSSLSDHTSPTDEFCSKFIPQCYHEALHNKRGQIFIEFACERIGGKYSSSYLFGCKADGKDLTKAILNEIGGQGYTTTINEQGSTVITTQTTTDVATLTSTSFSQVNATTTTDELDTQTTTMIDFETVSSTETIRNTTVIPITATSTSTKVITTTVPLTTTVATSTTTAVMLGNESLQIMNVALNPSPKTIPNRKRVQQVDRSQFCSSFNSACSGQCSRVHSKPKHVVCQSNGPNFYSLTCYCKNGKIETQHALAAAANQEQIVSISTLETSTSLATVTSTTIIPTTVVSTSIATITSHVPITQTLTSLSTVIQTGSTTVFTGISSTVATSVPVTDVTNTITSTTSVTATSTSFYAIAPTGAVEVSSQQDGRIQGYLSFQFFQSYYALSPTQANQFIAILDPSTGYIQLRDILGPLTFGAFDINVGEPSEYLILTQVNPDACGGSINAGPYNPSSNHCESFVLNPMADSQTVSSGTVSLQAVFYEPNSTTATQYSWAMDPFTNKVIATLDLADYNKADLSTPNIPVLFRYPVDPTVN